MVRLQLPLASAVAVPTCFEPSNTVTVLLAAAVPVSVSVLSLVMWSPVTPLSLENEAIMGADGGAVIVTTAAEDEAPVLPAASVAAAVKL